MSFLSDFAKVLQFVIPLAEAEASIYVKSPSGLTQLSNQSALANDLLAAFSKEMAAAQSAQVQAQPQPQTTVASVPSSTVVTASAPAMAATSTVASSTPIVVEVHAKEPGFFTRVFEPQKAESEAVAAAR